MQRVSRIGHGQSLARNRSLGDLGAEICHLLYLMFAFMKTARHELNVTGRALAEGAAMAREDGWRLDRILAESPYE